MIRLLPPRLLLPGLVLAVALPLAILLVHEARHNADARAGQRQLHAQRAAAAVAAGTAHLLDDAERLLVWLARQPEASALEEARCGSLFTAFPGTYPQYTNLITVRADGLRVCSAIVPSANAPVRVNPALYLEAALRSGRFTIGRPTRGVFTSRPILLVAQPIIDRAGQTSGVVALAIDIGRLRSASEVSGLPPQAEAQIVDTDDRPIDAGAAPSSAPADGAVTATAPVDGTAWRAVVRLPAEPQDTRAVELLLWAACVAAAGLLAAWWLALRLEREPDTAKE